MKGTQVCSLLLRCMLANQNRDAIEEHLDEDQDERTSLLGNFMGFRFAMYSASDAPRFLLHRSGHHQLAHTYDHTLGGIAAQNKCKRIGSGMKFLRGREI